MPLKLLGGKFGHFNGVLANQDFIKSSMILSQPIKERVLGIFGD